uniref:Uncharacterized protein n=1 Tax=Glossina morsitans morsitans TaxID=37546 RepID=A0A1B0GFZ6_GLOMM
MKHKVYITIVCVCVCGCLHFKGILITIFDGTYPYILKKKNCNNFWVSKYSVKAEYDFLVFSYPEISKLSPNFTEFKY